MAPIHHAAAVASTRNGPHPSLTSLDRAEQLAAEQSEARAALQLVLNEPHSQHNIESILAVDAQRHRELVDAIGAAKRAVALVDDKPHVDLASLHHANEGDADWGVLDAENMMGEAPIGNDLRVWHTGHVQRGVDPKVASAFGQPVLASDVKRADEFSMTCAQVFTRSVTRNPLQPHLLGGGGEGRGSAFAIDVTDVPGIQLQHVLVTNYHVVRDRVGDVTVSFPGLGARELSAVTIAVCPSRDIAFLGLREEDLTRAIVPLAVGNSDAVAPRTDCYAVGFPLGRCLCSTTAGVISGIEFLRDTGLMRHSAPINPGNSGGSLLVQGNGKLEVVGVNSRKLTNADGMGYAIPINEVTALLRSVSYDPADPKHETQLIKRAVLGATFQPSDATQALSLGNPSSGGYYVSTVVPNGLLDNGGNGLRRGDQITSIGVAHYDGAGNRDMPVDATGSTQVPWAPNPVAMIRVLDRLEHGDTLHLRVLRDGGQSVDLSIPYAITDPYGVREVLPEFDAFIHDTVGGMVVCELTLNHVALALRANVAGLAKYMTPRARKGRALLITHVYTASPASTKRLPVVSHILEAVNGVAVSTIADLHSVFQAQSTAPYWTFHTENGTDLVMSKAELLKTNEMTTANHGMYGEPSVAAGFLNASHTSDALSSLWTPTPAAHPVLAAPASNTAPSASAGGAEAVLAAPASDVLAERPTAHDVLAERQTAHDEAVLAFQERQAAHDEEALAFQGRQAAHAVLAPDGEEACAACHLSEVERAAFAMEVEALRARASQAESELAAAVSSADDEYIDTALDPNDFIDVGAPAQAPSSEAERCALLDPLGLCAQPTF